MPTIGIHQLNSPNIDAYNSLDCMTPIAIERALDEIEGSQPIYNFALGLQAPFMEMTLRGWRIDPRSRAAAIDKLEDQQKDIEKIITYLVEGFKERPLPRKNGHITFPNSSEQLQEYFYKDLGIPIPNIRGKADTAMDRDVIEQLQAYLHARPVASSVLYSRDLAKKHQTLTSEVEWDDFGPRMRCSFNIAGTSTGRLSSSKSAIGSGLNFQNITEELRHMFIADPGHRLYGIDKEQAEAREVGYLCGLLFDDWSYLDVVESGDPHTYVCTLIWPNLPWTGDPKLDRKIAERKFYRHFSYRDLAKRCAHGSNYAGQADTISNVLQVPTNIVVDFQKIYFKIFSCITKMHAWVARQVQTKGYLINVFGRRRDFFDRPTDPATIRGAIAYLFQSATADDMNLGIWRMWKHMGTKIQLLAQVHDAVYFQAPEEIPAEEIASEALELLNVKITCRGRNFSVPSEAKSGQRWANRFRYANDGSLEEAWPDGLDKISFKKAA